MKKLTTLDNMIELLSDIREKTKDGKMPVIINEICGDNRTISSICLDHSTLNYVLMIEFEDGVECEDFVYYEN
jgi:hypothetical protein